MSSKTPGVSSVQKGLDGSRKCCKKSEIESSFGTF